METFDVERPRRDIPVHELRRAIRRDDPRISRTLAARTLLSREALRPVAAARLILEAEEIDDDARLTAVRALGRTREAGAQELLIDALGSRNPGIIRDTAWSLARIGDEAAMTRLMQVDTRDRPARVREAVEGARRLLAFRLGVPGFGFSRDALPKVAELPRDDIQSMEISEVRADAIEPFRREILSDVPRLPLRLDTATQVTCLGRQLWLLATEEAAASPAKLLERPAVPVAVYGFNGCPGTPYLQGYVLSEPRNDGADIVVIRVRGQPTHAGRLSRSGRGLVFEVRALETRYDPASEITGELTRAGALRIADGRVSEKVGALAERRRRPKESVADLRDTDREDTDGR